MKTKMVAMWMICLSGLSAVCLASDPNFVVEPVYFPYSVLEGGDNPAAQTMTVHNSGQQTLNWVIADVNEVTLTLPDWLAVSPVSGSLEPNEMKTVSLSVDASGLLGGQYRYSFTIGDVTFQNELQTVTVDMEVIGPQLDISSNTILFSAYEGDPNPESQTLTISNPGGGTLNWLLNLTDLPDWLTVGPTSGSINHNDSQTVSLLVDIAGLPGGQYNYFFEINDSTAENSPQIVTVSLDVTGPRIEVSSNSFSFSAYEGGVSPDSQAMIITNSGGGTLNWQFDLTDQPDWLTIGPVSGSLDPNESEDVQLVVNTDHLSSGEYNYSFEISDPFAINSPQTVNISLEVLGPEFTVSTNEIVFMYSEGGGNPADQVLILTNSGGGILNWIADLAEKPDWLTVTPSNGTLEHNESVNVGLSVEIDGLSDDAYLYTFAISDSEASNSPQNMTIFLGKDTAKYGGGAGTKDDPYRIWTPEHLNNISNNTSDLDKCFKLMADIDMTYTEYSVIQVFSGEFDGDGHVISNLSYTNEQAVTCIGLFGYTDDAFIKNVTLENISISSNYRTCVGGLIGLNTKATVQNCHVTGVVAGSGYVGGLIGYNRVSTSFGDVKRNLYSLIFNCSSNCDVQYYNCDDSKSNCVGGLIGLNRESDIRSCCVSGNVLKQGQSDNSLIAGGVIGHNISGRIRKCRFNGNLNSNSGAYTGGIVGLNGSIDEDYWGNPAYFPGDSVMYCHVSGEIAGGDYTGGIAGCHIGSRVSHCESSCDVTGTDYVGGLVGRSESATIIFCSSSGSVGGVRFIGGLTGLNHYSDVRESYASSFVNGTSYNIGGLAGAFIYGNLTDCYATGSVTGTGTDGYVGGLVGDAYQAFISKCFSSGFVDATGSCQGGFIGSIGGYGNSTIITSSFWDTDTSGQSVGIGDGSSDGLLGQTTDSLKTLSTFTSVGWDFDNDDGTPAVWELPPDSYPKFIWQPSGGSSYAGGDGSIDDPYQIASVDDFNDLTVNSADWSKCFILTADIDLSDIVFCTSPIAPDRDALCCGFQGVPFTGFFNGNGHIISNLQIEAPDTRYVGLFGKTETAMVSNLQLDNALINGQARVGVLAGACSYGVISDCSVTGSVAGVEYVGGLCGYKIRGTIKASSADCSVTGRSSVGGLVGGNGHGTITQCRVANLITVSEPSGYSYAGGLAGCNTGDIEYSCCTSDLIVDGNEISVGGIAGVNYSGDITSVYTTGSVTSYGSSSNTSGGFIGYLAGGSVSYSYSTAAVTATGESGSAGGFIGDSVVRPFSVNSCVWDIESSGITYSSGGKPINSQLMKSIAVFQNAGWNNKGWIVNDGVDVPRLKWEDAMGSDIPPAQIPFEGSGTVLDPYRIYTAEEFALLSWYEGILDKDIMLKDDLDLTGVPLYPIGDLGTFTGRFKGNGHILYNVKIHQPGSDYIGLFSTNTLVEVDNILKPGLIKGVILVNADIIGNEYVGGVVGANIEGLIWESACSGSIEAIEGTVGGIAGYARLNKKRSGYIEINQSYSNAVVKGGYEVGGLVGNNELKVSECYASGPVISEGDPSGGLFGKNISYNNVDRACFWDIETTGQTYGSGEGSSDNLFCKTTAEMMTLSTYTDAGWDFAGESVNGDYDLWRMCSDGINYPRFWWEYTRRGDFVCEDGVDLNDFAALAGCWQSAAEERCDANADGVVNLLDLEIVAENWLK